MRIYVTDFCVTSRESKDQPAASPSAGGSLLRADTWSATNSSRMVASYKAVFFVWPIGQGSFSDGLSQ